MIDLNGTGQSYQRAAGSLGWAFPASLGAQCAAGQRRVVCFTGDGGFYYHLAELETARRCNIPLAVIVNNNSGFGENLTGVRRVSGNRPSRGEELIRFGPTDFTAVARSFGVRGIRVEQPQEIAPALEAALAADQPTLIDVVTDLESARSRSLVAATGQARGLMAHGAPPSAAASGGQLVQSQLARHRAREGLEIGPRIFVPTVMSCFASSAGAGVLALIRASLCVMTGIDPWAFTPRT